MKKYLLILLALTAGMFVSCNKDDSAQSNYVFYEPVMTWGIGMSETRSAMSKMTDWVEDTEMSERNTLVFENKKNEAAQISYGFESGYMVECSVSYLECNDKFSQMKDDWAKKLNLVWRETTILGRTVYVAECISKECTVSAQMGNASGFDYMIISFQKIPD